MNSTAILAAFCLAHGGELEHRLPDGARVDCLTATHAWEIDPSEKWAEAIGQALYYAVATDRTPGIVLVVDTPTGCRHLKRLWAALAPVSVPVQVEVAGDQAKC